MCCWTNYGANSPAHSVLASGCHVSSCLYMGAPFSWTACIWSRLFTALRCITERTTVQSWPKFMCGNDLCLDRNTVEMCEGKLKPGLSVNILMLCTLGCPEQPCWAQVPIYFTAEAQVWVRLAALCCASPGLSHALALLPVSSLLLKM